MTFFRKAYSVVGVLLLLEYLAQVFLIAATIFTIADAPDNAKGVYAAFKNSDTFAGLHAINGTLVICSGASPNGFTAGLGQNGLSVNVQSGATVGNGTTNNITLNDSNAVMNFGSRTTHIFCVPTCRHARRVQPQHLQHFHDESEARARGYRPCKVCRPALAV